MGFTNFKICAQHKANTLQTHATVLNPPPIMNSMNGVQLGRSTCPAEVLTIEMEDNTYFRVKIFYDTQAQATLCNDKITPLIRSSRFSPVPLGLTSINGTSHMTRKMATLELSAETKIEAIVLTDMNIDAREIEIPEPWHTYRHHWVNNTSHYPSVDAKILLAADCAILHPYNVVNNDGMPIEYKGARLMRSQLSGRYLAFGYLGENKFHPTQFNNLNTEAIFYSTDEEEANQDNNHFYSIQPNDSNIEDLFYSTPG